MERNEAVVKPILSGDSSNVKVKNCGDGTIKASPVFILSNRETFPDCNEFKCWWNEYWKNKSYIKHYKLYIYYQ